MARLMKDELQYLRENISALNIVKLFADDIIYL